jgi:hypothetical protein
MTDYVLRVWDMLGYAIADPNGKFPYPGQFLAAYDVNAHGGQGTCRFTDKLEEALLFGSAAAALGVYRSQSTIKPTRDDGQPNRPLTVFTMEVTPFASVVPPTTTPPEQLKVIKEGE